jgi:hypothetical protein
VLDPIDQGAWRLSAIASIGLVFFCTSLRGDISPPTKPAVPPAASRQDAQKTAGEIYGGQIARAATAAERLAMARMILQSGKDEKNNLAARYTLLSLAKDTAIEAGDLSVSCEAIDAIADSFEIDSPAVKADAAQQASRSLRTDEDRGRFVEQSDDLVSSLISAERFDLAKQVAELELTIARLGDDSISIRRGVWRAQQASDLQAAALDVRPAIQTLAKSPHDADANLKVGRYRCLVVGDWRGGLPMLNRGSDARLKNLATLELGVPSDAVTQLKIADGWWDVAEKESVIAKARAHQHATDWYHKALPALAGLEQLKAEKRVQEATAEAIAASTPPSTRPSGAEEAIEWTELTRDMETFRNCWKMEYGRIAVSFDAASHTVDIDGLREMGGFEMPRPWQQIAFEMALREGDLESITVGRIVLKSTVPLKTNTALHVWIGYDAQNGEVDELIDGQKVASSVVLDRRYPSNLFLTFFARGDTKLSVHDFYYLPAPVLTHMPNAAPAVAPVAIAAPIQPASLPSSPPAPAPPAALPAAPAPIAVAPPIAAAPPQSAQTPSLLRQVIFSVDAKGHVVITLDSRAQGARQPLSQGVAATLLYLKSADVSKLEDSSYSLAYFFDNPNRSREYRAALINSPLLSIGEGNLVIHPSQQPDADAMPAWKSTRAFGFPIRATIDVHEFQAGTFTVWLRPQLGVGQYHYLSLDLTSLAGGRGVHVLLTNRDVRGGASQQILDAMHPTEKVARYDAQLPFECDAASGSFGLSAMDGNVAVHSINIVSPVCARLPIGFANGTDGLKVTQIMAPTLAGGVQTGDHILAIDGQAVTSEFEAMWAVQQRHPGDDIQLQIDRGGEKRIVHMTAD